MPDKGIEGLVTPPGQHPGGNGDADPVTYRIVIEHHAKSGSVVTSVTDPHARLLCYGLLEMARDGIFKQHLAAEQAARGPQIAVVPGDALPPRPPR